MTDILDEERILRERAESLSQRQEEETADERAGVLLFALADEWYGVRIGDVREICNEYRVTPVPCAPESIQGVINLRGEIISVMDLRTLLRLPPPEEIEETEEQTALIIVEEESGIVTALVVDQIGDIIEVAEESMDPPLSTADKSQAEYVTGSVYVEGKLVALLSMERVLAPIGNAA